MAFREYQYRWVFDLKSTPEQLWPFVADTNRFNRDTGVPHVQVDSKKGRLRNARRKVRLSLYGMDVEWEEQPFEWVQPVRFGIERVYSKGPMARLRALADLAPISTGGTRVTYEVQATPRNLFGVLAIPLQIKFMSARKFKAAFKKYDELASRGVDPAMADATNEPPSADHARIKSLGEKLVKESPQNEGDVRPIVERLIELISSGDDFSVARIRPYQLADNWKFSRRLVLETCLRATRIGLLDLRWDLVCPMCRGAEDSGSSLRDIPRQRHCDTCEIDITANLDRYVELTFKPNAGLRVVEAQDFCIAGPQRTPHVVVQQLLAAGSERHLDLPLGPGNYRVRALELPGSQAVNVSASGVKSATINLTDTGWDDDVLKVSERSSILLKNQTAAEQLLILERTAWTEQAATAAEVTALQVFRDLFSSEALRPGEQISVGTLTVLFTDLRDSTRLYRQIGDATAFGRVMNHFDVLKKFIAERDGAIVKTIGDAVMAVFRSPGNALLAMIDAQDALANPPDGAMPLQLKAGMNTGPCIAVTLNDRLDYFGSTVNLAARLEGLSSGNDVIISQAVFEDASVDDLLSSGEYATSQFEAKLKGFDEEQAELWRVSRIKKN